MTSGQKRLKFFESGQALDAVNLGIISTSVFMKYIHYQEYLAFRSEGYDTCTAMQLTADKMKCHFTTIWRSVKYFD